MKLSKKSETSVLIKKIKPKKSRINSARSISASKLNFKNARPQTSINSQILIKKHILNKSNNNNYINKSEIENKNINLNLLNLMIESNPRQYNFKKIKQKVKEINPITSLKNKNIILPNMSKNTQNVLFKYNILYGNNSQNIIKTYSPKMRPKSSSVKIFSKTIKDKNDDLYLFNEKEILLLSKAKCQDIGIDFRENMYIKFKDFCNSKCKNRIVDLSECYLGINSIKVISDILFNTNRIARLNLTKNNIGDRGLEILINSIKNSISLVSLNLTSNSITYKGGNILFESFINQQSIIDLNISSLEGRNRNRLTSQGLKYIELYLINNAFIEILNLSGNSIRNEGFILICKGLKNYHQSLKHLDVSNNDIHEKGLKQGLEFINNSKIYTKIYNLNISNNNILDGGIISFTNNLRYFPNLHSINISFCGIEFNGFNYLLKTLQYIKRIEYLNISGNKLKDKNFDILKQYFSTFNIKYLNLAKCSLGDYCANILGQCISLNETLKTVNISGNEITDIGFKSFINIFKNNISIENFDCSCNFITDYSGKYFVKSLLNNKTLKTINFYDNQLHNEIGNLFIEILETNKSLIHINLNFNRIQVKTIEEINKILKLNYEKHKLSFIPDLLKNIKDLEFQPELFTILSEKILEKKNLQNFLYKKVKEDDKNFCTIISKENKKIEKEIKKLDEIKIEIKNYENEIKERKNEMEKNDKQRKLEENIIKDNIEKEKKLLNEIIQINKELKTEYNLTKNELELVLKKTEKNYELSKEKYEFAKNNYEYKNRKYIDKFSYYQDLINPLLLVPIKKPIINKIKSKKSLDNLFNQENSKKLLRFSIIDKKSKNKNRSSSIHNKRVTNNINNIYSSSTISTGNFNLNTDDKFINVNLKFNNLNNKK